MGEEIIVDAIEIVENGLIQIDFRNNDTGETFRAFCDPDRFFGLIGASMQKNFEQGGGE